MGLPIDMLLVLYFAASVEIRKTAFDIEALSVSSIGSMPYNLIISMNALVSCYFTFSILKWIECPTTILYQQTRLAVLNFQYPQADRVPYNDTINLYQGQNFVSFSILKRIDPLQTTSLSHHWIVGRCLSVSSSGSIRLRILKDMLLSS